MNYKIKKTIFCFFSIITIPFSVYWILFCSGSVFSVIESFQSKLGIWNLFHEDVVQAPVLIGIVLLPLASILFLIFYRRECRLWPKLTLLFTGIVTTITALDIATQLSYVNKYRDGKTGITWELILIIYTLIALITIVGLIIAMVKYPKKQS